MNVAKVNDLLDQIEVAARQIEGADSGLADPTGHIRQLVADLRNEVASPAGENAAPAPSPQEAPVAEPVIRTLDQISAKERTEYEWHDVTAIGDTQRTYKRGAKRSGGR